MTGTDRDDPAKWYSNNHIMGLGSRNKNSVVYLGDKIDSEGIDDIVKAIRNAKEPAICNNTCLPCNSQLLTTAKSIATLRQLFAATYGLPEQVVSDNGPQFMSKFTIFLTRTV